MEIYVKGAPEVMVEICENDSCACFCLCERGGTERTVTSPG
jgi:hypothetical protein